MIYVASSWRNKHFDSVAAKLVSWQVPIYNFKDSGFNFAEIDRLWLEWDREQMIEAITNSPYAQAGYELDREALNKCNGLLLVTPCGRSAHLELGYVAGLGKPTCIYLTEKQEPELLYKLADQIVTTVTAACAWSAGVERYALDRAGVHHSAGGSQEPRP